MKIVSPKGVRNDFQTQGVRNNENPSFVMIFEGGWLRVIKGVTPS
jgi:hypothetical protein